MGWRDRILEQFIPGLARLTLALDPDGLLSEEELAQRIRERGFALEPFRGSLELRFTYEAGYRLRWDHGERVELVVVLVGGAGEMRQWLPYDLLQGRELAFSLAGLFPQLSREAVAMVDRADLDALEAAIARSQPQGLGFDASLDFVLRHVYGIALELIQQPADLLWLLLRLHHHGRPLPSSCGRHLAMRLRYQAGFPDWPLEALIGDRQALMGFLQERWPLFLDRLLHGEAQALREAGRPQLKYPGPALLPFDHEDVRVYVDNLFTDGALQPVPHEQAAALRGHWAAVGVRFDPAADRARRLAGLIRSLEGSLPPPGARYTEWLSFARRWAELAVLRHETAQAATPQFQALQQEVDARFQAWVLARYGGLYNQPPPAMLHHVPHELSLGMRLQQGWKVALVVLDGCALDQWVVLREVLAWQRPGLKIHERAVFAWLPTITAVSRQAAFAGRPPFYFPGSLHTTEREPALWQQFWADALPNPVEAVYAKGLGDEHSLATVEELLAAPKVRVAGLVVDTIDRITAGMQLGTAGMHNQVRQWAEQGFLARLLDLLLARGYSVCLTSDHGNIEATGCGRPREGAMADLRGERVRVYPSVELRAHVQAAFPGAIAWPPLGLPQDYLALLAPGRTAFVPVGERLVAHGGLCIEELVVPLVRIESEEQ